MAGYPSPGTNVDSELHNASDTDGDNNGRASITKKKGLKGAAGGVYVGPAIINPTLDTDTAHATTSVAGGGVEDSTGYRKRDGYETTTAGPTPDSQTRPTSRAARTGAGVAGWTQTITLTGTVDAADAFIVSYKGASAAAFVAGTNMTSAAMQTALRSLASDPILTVTGTTDAGPFIITTFRRPGSGFTAAESVDSGTGFTLAYTTPRVIHGTDDTEAGYALGNSARGIQYPGVFSTGADPVHDTPQPIIEDSDAPAEGTIGIINGTAKFTFDMHSNDVSNYTGAEIAVFSRQHANALTGDGDFIGSITVDSATEGDALTTANVPELVAGTYAVYVRWIETDGNPGPWSARGTVVVS